MDTATRATPLTASPSPGPQQPANTSPVDDRNITRRRTPVKLRRLDIQGMRAVAVLLVVAAHAGVPGLEGGYLGVDVFFVLSGFLITGLLAAEGQRTGRIDLVGFYVRRARRILPAAVVVLVSTTVIAAWLLPTARSERVNDDALWSSVFLANVHFGDIGTDYFASDLPPSPLQHFWSLAVEEQFYLVWPLVVLMAAVLARALRPTQSTSNGRRSPRRRTSPLNATLAIIAALACAWSLYVALTASTEDATATYFSTTARVWELGAGALLALLLPQVYRVPDAARALLSAAGLVAVGVAVAIANEAFSPQHALLAVTGTVAMLAGGVPARTPNPTSRLLSWSPLACIGEVSYSLYLWHWPVLILGPELLEAVELPLHSTAVRVSVLVVASVVLAALSHYLVERPMLHKRVGHTSRGGSQGNAPSHPRGARRQTPWLMLWPAALIAVVAATLWSADLASTRAEGQLATARDYYGANPGPKGSAPLEERIDYSLRLADDQAPLPLPLTNLDTLADDGWEKEIGCQAGFKADRNDCVLGDPQAERTIAAVGDSHMGMWLPALDQLGQRQGFKVVAMVKFGCPAFDVPTTLGRENDPYPSCERFRDWTSEELRELAPERVLTTTFGLRNGSEDPAVWAQGANSTIQRWSDLGLEVTLLSDVTELSDNPADCLTQPDSTMSTCEGTETSRTRDINQVYREVAAATGASYVDLTGLVCQGTRCPLVVDRTVTYRDDDHVSVAWARAVTSRFGKLVDLG